MSDSDSERSKRYKYFHAALQLAIQRTATKWTLEEFAECFPTWAKESPEDVAETRVAIGQQMENIMLESITARLQSSNVAEGIDVLDAVIRDGRARKEIDVEKSNDIWRSGLEPRASVRARTVPLLQRERDSLASELQELEGACLKELEQFRARKAQRIETEKKIELMLDNLQKALEAFQALPVEEIEDLVMNTYEAGGIIST